MRCETISDKERLALILQLESLAPRKAAEFRQERDRLTAEVQKIASDAAMQARKDKVAFERERSAARKQLEREARSRGVSIGMSQAEVLASNWGRPKSKTVHASVYGETEQWIYPGWNFLYFRNGVLTDIQTSR